MYWLWSSFSPTVPLRWFSSLSGRARPWFYCNPFGGCRAIISPFLMVCSVYSQYPTFWQFVLFIVFLIYLCVCVLIHFSHVLLCVTLWTVAHQAPLSMGFSSKNTGVGCHFLLQGLFPIQGSNPRLLHCRWILYHAATWEGTADFLYSLWEGRHALVRNPTQYNSYSPQRAFQGGLI